MTAQDDAVEAYFHPTHRERHGRRDRRARASLAAFGGILLAVSVLALAGLFGLTTPWYLIRVAQITVCLDTIAYALIMIREAVRGGRA